MSIGQRLLGMFQTQPDQFQSLLGEYYDPKTARMKWLGGTLQGLGMGLASGQPGAWATGLTQGGGQAVDDYRKQAMQGYAVGQAKQDQDWQAKERARKEGEWAQEDASAAQMKSLIGQLPENERVYAQLAPEAWVKSKINPGGSTNGALGMTPIPLSDGKGGWAVGQLSPNGGVMVNGQPAGPEWRYDPFGLNLDKSKGTTVGKGQGDVIVSADSLGSKMPGLETVITKLDDLSEKATYSLAGQARDFLAKETGFGPTEGAVARTEYEAIVNNQILPLLRDTFGAQFTLQEGKDLRATLGDPNKTPPEKQAVLRAFIEQKMRDLEALNVQAGRPTPQSSGYNPGDQFEDAKDIPEGATVVDDSGVAYRKVNGQLVRVE